MYGKYITEEVDKDDFYICFIRMPTKVDSKIEISFGLSIVESSFSAYLVTIDDDFTIRYKDVVERSLKRNNEFDGKEFFIVQYRNGKNDCNYRILGGMKHSEIERLNSTEKLIFALDTIDGLINKYYDTYAMRVSQIYKEILSFREKKLEGSWFMNV